jgi:protein JBTS26
LNGLEVLNKEGEPIPITI